MVTGVLFRIPQRVTCGEAKALHSVPPDLRGRNFLDWRINAILTSASGAGGLAVSRRSCPSRRRSSAWPASPRSRHWAGGGGSGPSRLMNCRIKPRGSVRVRRISGTLQGRPFGDLHWDRFRRICRSGPTEAARANRTWDKGNADRSDRVGTCPDRELRR
jgi:hypothetical protein